MEKYVVMVGKSYLVDRNEPRFPKYSRNINEAKIFDFGDIQKFKKEVMKYSNIYIIKEVR